MILYADSNIKLNQFVQASNYFRYFLQICCLFGSPSDLACFSFPSADARHDLGHS